MNHFNTVVSHVSNGGDSLETPAQAAVTCNVSTGHLAACRANPRHPLKFIKVGAHVFYRREDLLDWNTSRQAKKVAK